MKSSLRKSQKMGKKHGEKLNISRAFVDL